MGFMGLSSWVDSDNAADFRYDLIGDMLAKCVKELKNEANQYNTCGSINIALVFESGLFDSFDGYEFDDYVDTLLKPLIADLTILSQQWKEERPRIKEMIKNIKNFCKTKNIKL